MTRSKEAEEDKLQDGIPPDIVSTDPTHEDMPGRGKGPELGASRVFYARPSFFEAEQNLFGNGRPLCKASLILLTVSDSSILITLNTNGFWEWETG